MIYEPGLTLITATGERPQAFRLCLRWVSRQTWEGPLQWIIVDDGPRRSPCVNNILSEFHRTVKVNQIFPNPCWTLGQNTLSRNILAAVPHILYDRILFIEDDDYYHPSYCEDKVRKLEDSPIVGSLISRYYHVPTQQYRIMKNSYGASLCQTGIRAELLPQLETACSEPQFIDFRLWQRQTVKDLTAEFDGCVGIKGLPGRQGIGMGHCPNGTGWQHDCNLDVLKSWIGEDATYYEQFRRAV